ncbi:reverse transcriptase domain-containing protein [Tanacetum coccineum]
MRNKYNELRDGNASKKRMTDDTPMCERHEANYIQSEDLNNDVKNDLEDFKRCVRSMRTIHSNLYERDDQSKIYLEKTITKFLDGQRVANMYVKNNVKDMILKMKQNEKNFQIIFKNMERKMDEWEKSQNVSSEQTDRTDPPPPQAHTEQVNVVFIGSGKSDDSLKILKDPPPPIIVNNRIDNPIKASKKGLHGCRNKRISIL